MTATTERAKAGDPGELAKAGDPGEPAAAPGRPGRALPFRRSTAPTSDADRMPLPNWPLTLMFVPYLLWWVLGIGDGIWGLACIPMLFFLVARGGIRIPRGFGIWALYLGWMCASVIEINTVGRLFGFLFRFMIYFGATVAFVYIYNSDSRRLPIKRIAGIITVFWLCVVFGGYLGILLPHGMIHTPMQYLVPKSIQQNGLVQQMIRPTFTQGDPNGFFHLALRPSAPFKYTNGWGTNYSLCLPFVFITLATMRRGPLFWGLVAMIPISLVPAYETQNRGMLLAIGLAVIYVGARQLLRGHASGLFGIALFALTAATVTLLLPVQELIAKRVSTGDTNATRLAVYSAALRGTLASPLLGYGAPRPSGAAPGGPSIGTQGQIWLVMFSSGFVGVALFIGFFLYLAKRTFRAPSTELLWLHTVILMMSLEMIYYGMMGSALVIAMIAGAAALRDLAPAPARALGPARGAPAWSRRRASG